MRIGKTLAVLAAVTTAGFAAPAMAQDANWGGFYAGALFGFGQGDSGRSDPYNAPDLLDGFGDGLSGTLVAGFNIQTGNFVFGLEAEASLLTIGYHGIHAPDEWDYVTANWSAAVAARAGVLLAPNMLVYGRIGYGYINFSLDDWGPNNYPPYTVIFDEGTKPALVGGFGVEVQMTEHLRFRAEANITKALETVSATYGTLAYTFQPTYGEVRLGFLFNF